ncbi:MAG TPA: hypothetical protein IAD49_03670 [Candidatus Fimihabitans intestinipullorum]|uniref:Portal protein n=1 Tax=Candidatus Fimihabitans intestinipullorum TaxID=2840820 RepID=A0A9D1HUA4_9BACT|nr:hypothetical protein [Candidatus Fimihabitans intestinipullorum]
MNNTKDWELYEAGVKYNQSLYGADRDYYDVINTNIAFANGDQWRNVTGEGLPKPVFNIIKRVKQFKIASLKSNNVAIQIQPMEYRPDDNDAQMQSSIHKTDLANAEVKNILENINFDALSRQLLNDGFDTGDMCLHFYNDVTKTPYKKYPNIKGVINAEVIDCTNVMFGNPNIKNVEKQPYIILVGRDLVKNLQEEYKRNNKKDQKNANSITEDTMTSYLAGDNSKVELEADKFGKALYILKYYRGKNGKIYVNKSVQNMYIYKEKETGYDYYPIAFNNWDGMKGSYHGRAETTGIIPNQIAINKMFAMVIYHLMLTAFPTAVYDATKVENWTNEIGAAIPINNVGNSSIRNIAGYLEPASMSGQIINAIELAMQYTKDTLGVGDASLGNITMDNATAIIAVQKSNAVPLENVRANLYELIEDCGRIILDMIATDYGIRPVVISEGDNRTVEEFDFGELKGMWLHIKADVGSASYFSEIASLQTLDNLLNAGRIEFIDYLKRIPDEIIPKKQELIQSLEQGDWEKQALYSLMDKFMQGLDPMLQQQLQQLEPEQMEKEILSMMGAFDNNQSEPVPMQPEAQIMPEIMPEGGEMS